MDRKSTDAINIRIPKKLIKIAIILCGCLLTLYLLYQAFNITFYFFKYQGYVMAIDVDTVITQTDVDKVTQSLDENDFDYKMSSAQIGNDLVPFIIVKECQMQRLMDSNLPIDTSKWSSSFAYEYPIFRWIY